MATAFIKCQKYFSQNKLEMCHSFNLDTAKRFYPFLFDAIKKM